MKARTLITQRQYFGLDALNLRLAAARVLARVVGLAPERARVSVRNLRQDFAVNTVEGQALFEELVAEGLLVPRAAQHGDYRLTERFLEFATARVVEPLPRDRAKQLVAKACELASCINREWSRNPFEVEAIATFGSYMSLDTQLAELPLGIVVRSRTTARRARWGRMATKAQGAYDIRAAFRELSSFVRVRMVKETRLLSRPFGVVFQE